MQQLEAADCGVACLAMVLGLWGREVRLDELRDAVGASGDGVDAQRIVDAAAQHGMRGRGLQVEIHELADLPRGAILHWEFSHFVVLDRVTRRGVEIVDPARGRRRLTFKEVDAAFTGVALELTPVAGFSPRRRRGSSATRYLQRLFEDGGPVGRVLAMSVLLQVLGMALPAVTGLVVDRIVPRADIDALWVVAGGSAIAVAFGALATLLRSHILVGLRTRLDMTMTGDFMLHLASLPYGFFLRRSAGDLIMRVNANALVREFLTTSVLEAVLDGTLVVTYLIVIALLSPSMAVLVTGLGLARAVVLLATHRRLREQTASQLDAQARSQSYLAQMLAGFETLKLGGAERRAVTRWAGLYAAELNQVARRGRLDALVHAILQALMMGSPLVVLTWGSALVLGGQLSLGTMLALNAFAVAFVTPVAHLVDAGFKLSTIGSHLERMDDVLEAEPEQPQGRPYRSVRLRGAISARNLAFRYGPDRPLAVDDVNLDIAPGQTVAIVGASGSGKSTLARLLLGLHVPTSGQVMFDGVDVRNIDLTSLRNQVGVVPQHPYLFGARIRDNIGLYRPDAPMHRLVSAARMAQIHDDIARLPMQYETMLADRGESLSGGQRQRIAIARALVQRPAVLLLDEATSALDGPTEAEVTRQLARIPGTRIVIAHRLSTVAAADVIIVMEGGRVVEVGRHDELCRRGRTYSALVASQSMLATG